MCVNFLKELAERVESGEIEIDSIDREADTYETRPTDGYRSYAHTGSRHVTISYWKTSVECSQS
jgi:hypothetical protein